MPENARLADWRAWNPLGWLGILVLLYLAVPVGAFFIRLAESRQSGFTTPGLFPALWVSIQSATIAVALIAVFGIPLAWVLARSHSRWADVVGTAVYLPLAVPPLISGILLIYLVGPYTYLGRSFDRRLTDSLTGVIIAQTFVAAPFLIVAARSAFADLDPGLEEVAAALGRRPLDRFFSVGLPVAGPGIRAGLMLAWLRAFGEYGATVLLAYHPASLPVYTYNQFSGTGLANTEAPTALAFIVAAVVVTLGRLHLPRRESVPAVPSSSVTPEARGFQRVRFALDVKVGTFHLKADHDAATHRLAILGPSGSGKSITLRCLAGLAADGSVRVWYGSEEVTREPIETREIGYVPQGYQLMPHLTVWGQVTFGRGSDPARAAYWMNALGLGGLAARRPAELSGGQRQRVCLAQSLARPPRILFLDEPFSALDTPVRAELRRELRRLQAEAGLSTVIVTHDPEEAALLADEILVLVDGRLAQAGSPAELYRRPATPDVARILGIANICSGRAGPDGHLEVAGTAIGVAVPAGIGPPGSAVRWCAHPEHLEILPAGTPSENQLDASVFDRADLGPAITWQLQLADGSLLEARTSKDMGLQIGDRCRIAVPVGAVTVWPAEEALSPEPLSD